MLWNARENFDASLLKYTLSSYYGLLSSWSNATVRTCFRGARVSSLADFSRLSAHGFPVFWYLTSSLTFDLCPARYIRITELESLYEFRTWADVHMAGCSKNVVKGKLLHSKPLMFHPPHVDNSDPERVA